LEPDSGDPLARLVAAVRAGPRYRQVAEELVRDIGARELGKARTLKEAVKATRNKLHQVGGVYLDTAMPYATWLDDLRAAAATGDAAVKRAACARVMAHHASTRERLPILDRFYAETLAPLGPIRSVLDLACGLNPLALPWLPLAPGAEYYACDIYADLVGFVGDCLALPLGPGGTGVRGRAEVRDLAAAPPTQRAELALLLKVVPCLDQVDRGAARRLIDALRVDHVLITFPLHGLGGRGKGMSDHYEARFGTLFADMAWIVRRFELPGERAFLLSR
jgi:16S rRNA (guanine(1405)-N(7))-methyltransferase